MNFRPIPSSSATRPFSATPQIAVGVSLILPPFRSPDKPEPVRLEGSRSLAPVVGSGASNRAKRCRLAPSDYAIDRAFPLAEIFTALLAAVLVKT